MCSGVEEVEEVEGEIDVEGVEEGEVRTIYYCFVIKIHRNACSPAAAPDQKTRTKTKL